jgi:hypothetical protein
MMIGSAKARWLVIIVVTGHMTLLAAYTFPATWVPDRLRYWSQTYARILFHQDWRLFAPDPPACPCTLQVKGAADADWTDLGDVHSGSVWERMCANACRYAEAGWVPQDSVVRAPIALTVSLEQMAESVARKGLLEVRMQRCPEMHGPVLIDLIDR